MLTKLNPDARAVKTSINLVPAGTLIFKPVNIPLEIVPIEITPVSEGVNVTVVPGTTVIVLFGAIDSYNFASIVIVLPTNDNAAVVEKNTSIEVMTPSLGIVKAKFVNVPDGLVKSIVLPMIDIPGAELPNPINAGVPTKPPAIVVKNTGKPDANGIIAEAPAAAVVVVAVRVAVLVLVLILLAVAAGILRLVLLVLLFTVLVVLVVIILRHNCKPPDSFLLQE